MESSILNSFFTDETHRIDAKTRSAIYFDAIFDSDIEKNFIENNARVGFLNYTVSLPYLYYEAAMQQLENITLAYIGVDQSFDTLNVISRNLRKLLNIAKYVSVKAFFFCQNRYSAVQEESEGYLLRSLYHDFSNQLSIIEGVVKSIKRDPSPLEEQTRKLEQTTKKLKSSVLTTRKILSSKEDFKQNYSLSPISLKDVLAKSCETMQYKLMLTNSVIRYDLGACDNETLNTNAFVLTNHVIINFFNEVIQLTPDRSNYNICVHKQTSNSRKIALEFQVDTLNHFSVDQFSFNLKLVEDFVKRISGQITYNYQHSPQKNDPTEDKTPAYSTLATLILELA